MDNDIIDMCISVVMVSPPPLIPNPSPTWATPIPCVGCKLGHDMMGYSGEIVAGQMLIHESMM